MAVLAIGDGRCAISGDVIILAAAPDTRMCMVLTGFNHVTTRPAMNRGRLR